MQPLCRCTHLVHRAPPSALLSHRDTRPFLDKTKGARNENHSFGKISPRCFQKDSVSASTNIPVMEKLWHPCAKPKRFISGSSYNMFPVYVALAALHGQTRGPRVLLGPWRNCACQKQFHLLVSPAVRARLNRSTLYRQQARGTSCSGWPWRSR